MANTPPKPSRKSPNRKLTDQLNVRIPEELMRRITAVAGAKKQSLTQFVIEALDERTKEHKPEVQKIAEQVQKIAEREASPKKWQ